MPNKASISAGKFNIKMLTYSKLISLFGLKGSADSSASTFSSSNVSGTSIKKHVCRIIEIFTRLQGFHRFVKKESRQKSFNIQKSFNQIHRYSGLGFSDLMASLMLLTIVTYK